MKHSSIVALAVFLWLGTASAAEYRTGQPVMGTILQVTVIAPDTSHAREAADAAIAEAKRWDDVLTIWRESGELAKLNRSAGEGPIHVSRELHGALEQMTSLAARTDGAFDPAVGPLVALWSAGRVPSSEAMARIAPVRISSVLTLGADEAALATGATLDPGAIGKGIALDAAVEVLRAAHVDAAFLDFGGSSQTAVGSPPDSPRGWEIAIAGLASGEVHGVLALRDASVSTSRTRGPEAEDGRIVDPRSGLAISEARLVTVRARSATDADAWSTALIVLGRNGIQKAVKDGAAVFFEDAGGTVETPGFASVSK